MNCEELIEYLSQFDPKSGIAVMIVDLGERIVRKVGACQLLDDPECGPVLIYELSGKPELLDDVLEEKNDEHA
jgi:hypothetical protein